jgi:hypothetical protein
MFSSELNISFCINLKDSQKLTLLSSLSLGAGSEERLGELLRLLQTLGNLDSVDGSLLLVLRPGRSSDVSTNNGLNSEDLVLLDDHRASDKLVLELGSGLGDLGAEKVVGADVLEKVEPELRETCQESSLVLDSLGFS